MTAAAAGGAFSVLRKRAVSCSFSSIYHLPAAGTSPAQFKVIDKAVRFGVVLPVLAGLAWALAWSATR
jgi:hypothetical protein